MEINLYKFIHSEFITFLKDNHQEIIYALTSGSMAILRNLYYGESIKNTLSEGCMCALAALSIGEFLIIMDLPSNLAFPTAVLLGYLGISPLLRNLRFKNNRNNKGKM